MVVPTRYDGGFCLPSDTGFDLRFRNGNGTSRRIAHSPRTLEELSYCSGGTITGDAGGDMVIANFIGNLFREIHELENVWRWKQKATLITNSQPSALLSSMAAAWPKLYSSPAHNYILPPPSYKDAMTDSPPSYTSVEGLDVAQTLQYSTPLSSSPPRCCDILDCLHLSCKMSLKYSILDEERSSATASFDFHDRTFRSHANEQNNDTTETNSSGSNNESEKNTNNQSSGSEGDGTYGGEQPMESGSGGKDGAGSNHGGSGGDEEQDKNDDDGRARRGAKKKAKSRRQQEEEAELVKEEDDDEEMAKRKKNKGKEAVTDTNDNELGGVDRAQEKEIDDPWEAWTASSPPTKKKKAKRRSTLPELVMEPEPTTESSAVKGKDPWPTDSAAIDKTAREMRQILGLDYPASSIEDANVVRVSTPESADLSRYVLGPKTQNTPRLKDGKGRRATVEEDGESEDKSWDRDTLGDEKQYKAERRDNKSPVPSEHVNELSNAKEQYSSLSNDMNSKGHTTGRKVHFDTDDTYSSSSSSGVRVAPGSEDAYTSSENYDDEDDDGWDLIDDTEITPSTTSHHVQPHPQLPRRQRRRLSSSEDDYPYDPRFRSHSPAGSIKNPFAPQPGPYGYPTPGPYMPPYGPYGFPPPPMPGHMPNPYAPSPTSYAGAYVPSQVPLPNYSAHTGMQNGPYVPIGATSAYPPDLSSMEPPPSRPSPPPLPPSPPPNSSTLRPPGSGEIATDSEGSDQPRSSRRNPRSKSRKWKQRRYPKRPYYDGYDQAGTGRLQGSTTNSKCHPYNIPFDDHGEQLSIDIRLRAPGMKQLTENNILRSSLGVDFGLRNPTRTQMKLNIVGAKRWFDSISQHTLDLTCSSASKDEETTQDKIRWLHVEEQCPDFDDFRAIILGSDTNLSPEWSVVLLGLLERVHKLHYDHSTGRYSPWMLRANSSELALQDTADTALSAITVNFPYFALGSIFGHGPRNTKHQFPVMSLFECDDRFESAKEWDLEQSFRLMNSGSGDKESIIYVPHVWAVVFDNTIITYGQVAFDSLTNDSFRVHEQTPEASGSVHSVKIIDLQGCEFALSLDQCRTFFALKQSIKVRVQNSPQDSFENISICTPNNQEVTGERWIQILQNHNSGMVVLRLQRKERQSEATAEPKSAKQSSPLKAVHTESYNQSSKSTDGVLTSRLRIDASESGGQQSSSESDSETNEPSHNSKALILLPRKVPSGPSHQTADPFEEHNSMALTLRRPTMLPMYPPLHQPMLLDALPMVPVGSDTDQRKQGLAERGIIVFDAGAIETTPEIYAPPNDAATGFRLRNTSAVSANPILHDQPQEEDTQATETNDPQDDGPVDATEDDPDEQSSITIPHFLSWATSQESTMEETLSESSIESIVRILGGIHETLLATRLPRHERTYRRSREIAQADLEAEFPSLRTHQSDQNSQTSAEINENQYADKQQPLLSGVALTHDRVRTNLLQACENKLRNLYAVLNSLLSLYIPLSSPSTSGHPLVQKCWGAFETIMADVTSGTKDEPQAMKYQVPEFWIIRDPSVLSMLSNLQKPAVSWKECGNCRTLTQYRSLREAMQHVQSHYAGVLGNEDNSPNEDTLILWLRTDTQYYSDHRLELYIHYLDLIVDPLREVNRKGRSIWDGVASDKSSMPSRFMLPKSLVHAFESAVLLLVCTAKAFSVINRCSDPMNRFSVDADSNTKKYRDSLQATSKDSFQIGHRAKESMNRAERDVMLMAYTDIDTETVSYDSVSPEYILATIMAGLFSLPLHADEPIDMVYAGFYRTLNSDAMKHPRTRMLRKIWRMREELDLITIINIQQDELFKNYLRVLEPCTFRVTTFNRAARFRTEAPFIHTLLRKAYDVRMRISDLDSRLEDVSSHVSRMLEIQQENNGNAIIVFTMVTIIFLPLSWATSYLGMNTSDIRNLSQGQWLFWLIALPVTGVVIGLATLVVLKGENIREYFIMREVMKDRQGSAAAGMSAKRALSTRMTGGSMKLDHSPSVLGDHLWRGFRRRTTVFNEDSKV